MIPAQREAFNSAYKDSYYEHLKELVTRQFGEPCPFRISETPVFIGKELKAKVFIACEAILEQLAAIDFDEVRQKFLPKEFRNSQPIGKTHFLAIDFGLCEEEGEIVPKLIELQAFPSLFFYQPFLGRSFYTAYPHLPEKGFHYFLSGLEEESYTKEVGELLLGGHRPENVILLELFPEKQKTRIDFYATRQALGIEVVCYTRVIREGKQLFYEKNGRKIPIRRIYNRVIYDELERTPDLKTPFGLFDELDVEWVTHPAWFFLISKCIMPLLEHKSVPPSYYLTQLPEDIDLTQYVLKPLFSFAGTGINLNPTREFLAEIPDKHNYLLQRKVRYAPLVKTKTDKNAKVELRILYIWNERENRLKPVINLTRMAKGDLINVSHLTDETWIGSSISLFEEG